MSAWGEAAALEGDNLALAGGEYDRFAFGARFAVDPAEQLGITVGSGGPHGYPQHNLVTARDDLPRQLNRDQGQIDRFIDADVDKSGVDLGSEPITKLLEILEPILLPAFLRPVGEDVEEMGHRLLAGVGCLVQVREQAVGFG